MIHATCVKLLLIFHCLGFNRQPPPLQSASEDESPLDREKWWKNRYNRRERNCVADKTGQSSYRGCDVLTAEGANINIMTSPRTLFQSNMSETTAKYQMVERRKQKNYQWNSRLGRSLVKRGNSEFCEQNRVNLDAHGCVGARAADCATLSRTRKFETELFLY